MLDSFDMKSRQERIRDFLKQFVDGDLPATNLTMKLYPSELDRFKDEFPNLNFDVTSVYRVKQTHSHKTQKYYYIRINRKS